MKAALICDLNCVFVALLKKPKSESVYRVFVFWRHNAVWQWSIAVRCTLFRSA